MVAGTEGEVIGDSSSAEQPVGVGGGGIPRVAKSRRVEESSNDLVVIVSESTVCAPVSFRHIFLAASAVSTVRG